MNMNLIGFENGVYDLSSGQFRAGLPEDNISLTTEINY
jgi:phage/plasmid-associated DNA primase